jgi:hypothetical protein
MDIKNFAEVASNTRKIVTLYLVTIEFYIDFLFTAK